MTPSNNIPLEYSEVDPFAVAMDVEDAPALLTHTLLLAPTGDPGVDTLFAAGKDRYVRSVAKLYNLHICTDASGLDEPGAGLWFAGDAKKFLRVSEDTAMAASIEAAAMEGTVVENTAEHTGKYIGMMQNSHHGDRYLTAEFFGSECVSRSAQDALDLGFGPGVTTWRLVFDRRDKHFILALPPTDPQSGPLARISTHDSAPIPVRRGDIIRRIDDTYWRIVDVGTGSCTAYAGAEMTDAEVGDAARTVHGLVWEDLPALPSYALPLDQQFDPFGIHWQEGELGTCGTIVQMQYDQPGSPHSRTHYTCVCCGKVVPPPRKKFEKKPADQKIRPGNRRWRRRHLQPKS